MQGSSAISIRTLSSAETVAGRLLSLMVPILDAVLGIRTIDRLYREHDLCGLSPAAFFAGALAALEVEIESVGVALTEQIPRQGSLLILCNHPYGGIEALVLAQAVLSVRNDLKILANSGLRVFRELESTVIATEPLRVTQKNIKSIRQCEAHLASGGILVVFPAGRVSSYQASRRRITDAPWNRLVGHLALRTRATVLPVYFFGRNSALFQASGRILALSKLLLLPRELLRLRGRRIAYATGKPVDFSIYRRMNAATVTAFSRLLTYANARTPAAAPETGRRLPAVMNLPNPSEMASEIQALPTAQRLLDFRDWSVYFARAAQMPAVMMAVARERERTFRELDEGSGESADQDDHDQRYLQLFVWDHAAPALVGAYRIGQTDLLLSAQGPEGLYLSRMFEFAPSFHHSRGPALELGRSFIVPEHQRSFRALYLLWRGIGSFLVQHPRYRNLYGTVSLSRQYDSRAVAMLCDALIEHSDQVRPRIPLPHDDDPEWREFVRSVGRPDQELLDALLRSLDPRGRGLPVLLRQYMKLGARFHCAGLDPGFSDTPGLLLSVDMPRVGEAMLETFLGDGTRSYLDFGSTGQAS